MITRALRERKPKKEDPWTTSSLDLEGIFTLRAHKMYWEILPATVNQEIQQPVGT